MRRVKGFTSCASCGSAGPHPDGRCLKIIGARCKRSWSARGQRRSSIIARWRLKAPRALYLFLLGAELWSARVAEHSGRNRGFTQASYVSGFEIVIPPTLDEQTAIAAVLSDMDAEIAALEAKLAKARGLK